MYIDINYTNEQSLGKEVGTPYPCVPIEKSTV